MSKFLYAFLGIFVFATLAYAQTGRRPEVYNLSLSSSATEYSLVVGTGNKPLTQIQVKCRTLADIYFGWSSGDTSDSYVTIEAGSVYFENDLKYTGSIYLKGSADSLTAEILTWD